MCTVRLDEHGVSDGPAIPHHSSHLHNGVHVHIHSTIFHPTTQKEGHIMARKNRNATKRRQTINIPKGRHFMYSPHEDGSDATVVRYIGEQDGDFLLCWHPDGFAMWIHMHQMWNPTKRAA